MEPPAVEKLVLVLRDVFVKNDHALRDLRGDV
jgi:hypothetical protein